MIIIRPKIKTENSPESVHGTPLKVYTVLTKKIGDKLNERNGLRACLKNAHVLQVFQVIHTAAMRLPFSRRMPLRIISMAIELRIKESIHPQVM